MTIRSFVKQIIHKTPHPIISENYEAFHKHLPVATFWIDLENRIRGFNDKLLQLIGNPSPETIEGAREEDLISTDNWTRLQEMDKAADLTLSPQVETDLYAYLANGKDVHLEIARIPLQDPNGARAGILVTYTDVTERHTAKQQAAKQQAALEERNQAIEFDLDSAQQIQKFLMGKQAEGCPYLDVAFRYQYVEKVGGDYLCFRSLEGGAYSLLLADLTGHGVTAALFMALLKYISQETPEEVRVLPGYFLNYLDMEFYEQIPNGFFTAFAATAHYNSDKNLIEVDYANAAHPASIIVRTDGSYELLESGDFAVGLLDLIERKPHTIELQFGDRLYAYTDGFLETIDPDGNEFGLERLCLELASHRDLPIKESIAKAYERLSLYSQSDDPQDDMTILAIEAKESIDTATSSETYSDPWGFN